MTEATTPPLPAPRPVLAVNSQTVPGASAAQLVEAVAGAALDAVEITGELLASEAGLAQQLRERGIRLLGVSPTRDLHSWHWRWDDALGRALELEMRRAAEAGAAYFVMPFMEPSGDAESVRRGLLAATPIARQHGLRLAVESIGHHPVVRRLEELVPVVSSLDGDVAGVLLDSFHFFRAGHAVTDLALLDAVPVVAAQLSNSNGRPLEDLLGYRDRTFPLDGPFDVVEFTRELLGRKPTTPLVVEVIGDVANDGVAATGVHTAAVQLNDIMTAIDLTGAAL
ncbi:sugar phosphate isomerase/epimerase family protein [Pseudactinotalea terrae]|uniref:sugar phosphate isomerase/epimerase family protein n=1 Tax=Pseudactinotalea terrae TaxID=1743262 RepID=UPI0012E22D0B|nr:sugar phosphate isomerase/epimerase [Pseudactinotalea terrae]